MRVEWNGDDELVVSYPDDVPPPDLRTANRTFGRGGRGRVTYRAVPRREIPEVIWTRDGEGAVDERTTLERGVVVALSRDGETSYSFSYADSFEPDPSVEWLQERGFQGSGDTWAGIVYGLVARHELALWPRLELDPESGSLSVTSRDREAVLTVARLVARAKREPAELEAAIRRAVQDGRMIE
jgi:hypothetical protein